MSAPILPLIYATFPALQPAFRLAAGTHTLQSYRTNQPDCVQIQITFPGKNPPPQITKLDIYPSAQITDIEIYLPARITILPFPAHLKITNHTLHGMPRIANMHQRAELRSRFPHLNMEKSKPKIIFFNRKSANSHADLDSFVSKMGFFLPQITIFMLNMGSFRSIWAFFRLDTTQR